MYIHQKALFPNEARLKNLTYKTELQIDVIIEIKVNEEDHPVLEPIVFSKVPLGNIPIMLRSNICSTNLLDKAALRASGECEYDQGGYFIFDGKEKVIVAQERQIENKLYTNLKPKDPRYKIISEIRSAPEDKFQPARITKVVLLDEKKKSNKTIIDENTLRVIVPQINGEVPLMIVYRALGIISDYDILNTIVDIKTNNKFTNLALDFLRPSVIEGSVITNQQDAIEFIGSKISKSFLKNSNQKEKIDFTIDILRNHFLPHCGTNLYDKAYFLSTMVKELFDVEHKFKPETDRDSFLFKRVDLSGFLISNIFRDLYFRVKNNLIEKLNVAYAKAEATTGPDGTTRTNYWEGKNADGIYNITSFIGSNNEGIVDIKQIVDRTFIDEGFMYAFKNCWGLKNAPCKEGIVQDINRISYLGFISHIRRVNTPLSASAKIRAPHALHGSSWGIMCPSETPDGANIGVRKNISILSNITFGTNSSFLEKLIFTSNVHDIKQVDPHKHNGCKIFLNERLIGYTFEPDQLYLKLKTYKRNALINVYTSIAWYKSDNIMKVTTDSGRGIRPVFVVKNNNINLTKELLDRIRDKTNKLNWFHLISGFQPNKLDKVMPFDDTDEKCYHIDDELLQAYRMTEGIIEYIDSEESNTSLIAMNPADLESEYDHYDYCEITPSLIFGVLANNSPGLSMNQAPRNQYLCAQGKQCLGMYATNYRDRFDVKGQIMHYPQKSIVSSKYSKYLNTDVMVHGFNTVVAIGCYSGYNQEDSIIFNLDSVNRGMFRSAKFRSYAFRDEIERDNVKEVIENPITSSNVSGLKSGNYSKLDENGIVKENVKVDENDVIIGKVVYTGEKDENLEIIKKDNSEFIRRAESGYVDKVYSNLGNDNQRYCKVRIRKDKIPEIGDKFASRHGQKGTIGMLLPSRDLPRTKDGIVPDIIVNTHAFPSRMTIAQIFEVIMGKLCLNYGLESEVTPFAEIETDAVRDMLLSSNIEPNGQEVFYSGITGEQLHLSYYVGPTYYQRLTHQVSDKYQSRDQGLQTSLTHQPVGGRALGGGGRIGEMERDAVLSHGASIFLKESFMERSDKYQFWISTKTGLISAVNPNYNIYTDLANDPSIQYVNEFGQVEKKYPEVSNSEFVCIHAPYSFKLFLQEVEATGIAPRLVSEKIIKTWGKRNEEDEIIEPIMIDANYVQSLAETKNDAYYVTEGSYLAAPLRSFHNKIKSALIKSSVDKRNRSLIDFSVGRAGDLYKWYYNGLTRVLGIDIDKSNIESKDTNINSASMRLAEFKNNDNPQISDWANKTNIRFMVGDSSKDFFNDPSMVEESYNDLRLRVIRNERESYGCAMMHYAIHYLFNNEASIKNLFKNVSNMIEEGGFFAVTTLDGNLVYNKLKESPNGEIEGSLYDRNTQEHIKMWGIKMTDELRAKNYEHLPSDKLNGFNNNILAYVDSIGNEFPESLVHPALLISIAKEMGFELASYNDMLNRFDQEYKYPTDLFSNVYTSFVKHNNNDLIESLGNDTNIPIKNYTDLHRYYVFKKSEDPASMNRIYETMSCNSLVKRKQEPNQRYPDIKLPFITSLDTNQINDQINVLRKLIGNTFNNKNIQPRLPIELKDNLENINHNVYISDRDSFDNTIKYISEYTKTAIYVRIINGKLISFVPIVSNEVSKLFKLFDVEEIEEGEVYDEDIPSLIFKSSNGDTTTDIANFIKAKNRDHNIAAYYEEAVFDGRQDLQTDYCIVTLGLSNLNRVIPQYFAYKHMIEKILSTRSDNISDSEFFINVLEHPIIKKTDGPLLPNPMKDSEFVTDIPNKLIPIISSKTHSQYSDLLGIDYFTYSHANNLTLPIDSKTCIEINSTSNRHHNFDEDGGILNEADTKYTKSAVSSGFALFYNFNGCSSDSNEDNLRTDIVKKLISQGESDLDYYYFSNINYKYLPNITYQNKIIYQKLSKPMILSHLSGIEEQWNQSSSISTGYLYPANTNYLFVTYISGLGSDEILTNMIFNQEVIYFIKDSNDHFANWYEKYFIPYNFGEDIDSDNNRKANIIIQDVKDSQWNINDLDFMKTNVTPEISERIRANIISLHQKIFNNDLIADYYTALFNKIGNIQNNNYINSNIKRGILGDKTNTLTKIFIKSDSVPFVIGKGGKKINYIKKISGAKINIAGREETRVNVDGSESTPIEISGNYNDVAIASKMLKKASNIFIDYYLIVSKNDLAKLIGKKGSTIKKIQSDYNIRIFTQPIKPQELTAELFAKVGITSEAYSENPNNRIIKIISNEQSDLDRGMEHIRNMLDKKQVTKKAATSYLASTGLLDFDYSSAAYDFPLQTDASGYAQTIPRSPDYSQAAYSYPLYTDSYGQAQPGFMGARTPDSPPFIPGSPKYIPESPEYRPTSPQYSPSFVPHSPDYAPEESPEYIPDSPLSPGETRTPLTFGWRNASDGSEEIYESMINNSEGTPTEKWFVEDNDYNLPDRYPKGWNKAVLKRHNISRKSMIGQLDLLKDKSDNWDRAIEILKSTEMRPNALDIETHVEPDADISRPKTLFVIPKIENKTTQFGGALSSQTSPEYSVVFKKYIDLLKRHLDSEFDNEYEILILDRHSQDIPLDKSNYINPSHLEYIGSKLFIKENRDFTALLLSDLVKYQLRDIENIYIVEPFTIFNKPTSTIPINTVHIPSDLLTNNYDCVLPVVGFNANLLPKLGVNINLADNNTMGLTLRKLFSTNAGKNIDDKVSIIPNIVVSGTSEALTDYPNKIIAFNPSPLLELESHKNIYNKHILAQYTTTLNILKKDRVNVYSYNLGMNSLLPNLTKVSEDIASGKNLLAIIQEILSINYNTDLRDSNLVINLENHIDIVSMSIIIDLLNSLEESITDKPASMKSYTIEYIENQVSISEKDELGERIFDNINELVRNVFPGLQDKFLSTRYNYKVMRGLDDYMIYNAQKLDYYLRTLNDSDKERINEELSEEEKVSYKSAYTQYKSMYPYDNAILMGKNIINVQSNNLVIYDFEKIERNIARIDESIVSNIENTNNYAIWYVSRMIATEDISEEQFELSEDSITRINLLTELLPEPAYKTQTVLTPRARPTQTKPEIKRTAASPIADHRWESEVILGVPVDHVVYSYNKNKIPIIAKSWTDQNIRYLAEQPQEIKDIIRLLTEKSMKGFNCIIDPPTQEQIIANRSLQKLYKDDGIINILGIDKMREYTQKIKEYADNSPLLTKDIEVYSGIDKSDYEKLRTSGGNVEINRFMGTTFDKEFANRYAMLRMNQHIKSGNATKDSNLIVYKITIPAGTRGIFYLQQENQIVLLPGIKIKINGESIITQESHKEIYQSEALPESTRNIENVPVIISN